jgi:uncharacterized membrane protein YbhN (UPF0104 family)
LHKQRIRSITLSFLTLGIIAAFVYYLIKNADKYLDLLRLSQEAILSIIIVTLVSIFINGLITTLLFQGLGANLAYRNGFYLAAASTLANQLPISGGMIARGVYLKRKHKLSYAKFFSSSLALFVIFVSVNGFFGLVVLLYKIFLGDFFVSPFLLTGFVAMTACIFIFWLPLTQIRFSNKLFNWISQALEGWEIISKSYLLVLKLIGLQTCLMIMLAIRYWVAFHILSQEVTIGDVILFASASVLTQLVSIAPGGLGVTEAIVGGIASIQGFELGVSIVAVGLDRLISTSVILFVGGISMIILGEQISDNSSIGDT